MTSFRWFSIFLHLCALAESSLSIGRVKYGRCMDGTPIKYGCDIIIGTSYFCVAVFSKVNQKGVARTSSLSNKIVCKRSTNVLVSNR